jgi:GT2 family glycosyltransferase
MKIKIFYIILTYKPELDLLDRNLQILEKEEVIVVDNSEDKTVSEGLRKMVGEKGELIVNQKNIGYAGGMNVGMKYAFAEGADWVVLLNDDIVLSKPAIQTIRKSLEKQEPAILGPYGGTLDKNRWTTILNPKLESAPDYISGSFMILHKKIYDLVQGFYPDYFMYYEDVDVCMQAKKGGFPIIHLDIPEIEHKDGASIEKGSDIHEYYLARNHLLFVERQAPLLIKLREFIRLPKTIYDHKFFMNRGRIGI